MLINTRRRKLNTSPFAKALWAAGRKPALVATALLGVLGFFFTARISQDNGSLQLDSSILSLKTPSSIGNVDLTSNEQSRQLHQHGRRVIVVTVWSHYPDLMPLQITSARAFLQHPQHHPVVEIIAVTNANNYTQRWELDRVAKQLGVHVLPVHDAWKYQDYPSLSHINALNFVMRALLRGHNNLLTPQFPLQDDILFFLDSDMFLMEPVSLVQELNGAALLSPLQTKENKHTYLWPNLSVFSFGEWVLREQQRQQQQTPHWMERWTKQWFGEERQTHQEEPYRTLYMELNFDACFPECPCDCGGCTKFFLERHPDLMVKNWTNTCSADSSTNVCQFWNQQLQVELPSKKCTQPQVFGPIYHLGSAGSNWRGCNEDFLRQRRQDVFDQMRKVLPQDIYERHNILLDASENF